MIVNVDVDIVLNIVVVVFVIVIVAAVFFCCCIDQGNLVIHWKG